MGALHAGAGSAAGGEGSTIPVMSRVREIGRKIGAFLGEVGAEFRKTTWPERRELVESTLVVISFIVLLSAVVLVCDQVIKFVLAQIRA